MKLKTLNPGLKVIVIVLIFPLALGVLSCSGDDGDDNGNGNGNIVLGCDQLMEQVMTYSDAFDAFQANPSVESCEDLKSAALDFISAIQNCPEYADQYSDLEEAALAWTSLDCSEEFGQ